MCSGHGMVKHKKEKANSFKLQKASCACHAALDAAGVEIRGCIC